MTLANLFQWAALLWAAGASAALAVSDVRWRRIPNRIVLPAAFGIAVLLALTQNERRLLVAVCGGAALAAAHLVLAVAGGLGGGDVKLALFIGIPLGYFGGWGAVLLGGALGWVFAGVGAAVQAGLRSRMRRCRRTPEPRARGLPFAPFLLAGSWPVILGCVLATYPSLKG
ncbi:prepilin peptidase [Leucobacter insecticola]|uniref:Prepilin peptidase n=1 Tax=Leucobacter insecticola TaxID=2714934 RepID=A0A6G8FKH5_9MICO|nr:prepilin peptidase [Leucobacter insecticola]QIM16867.1 prepilin peptidase [Leucobacter insecticola]